MSSLLRWFKSQHLLVTFGGGHIKRPVCNAPCRLIMSGGTGQCLPQARSVAWLSVSLAASLLLLTLPSAFSPDPHLLSLSIFLSPPSPSPLCLASQAFGAILIPLEWTYFLFLEPIYVPCNSELRWIKICALIMFNSCMTKGFLTMD